jgi:hypothetical protein
MKISSTWHKWCDKKERKALTEAKKPKFEQVKMDLSELEVQELKEPCIYDGDYFENDEPPF